MQHDGRMQRPKHVAATRLIVRSVAVFLSRTPATGMRPLLLRAQSLARVFAGTARFVEVQIAAGHRPRTGNCHEGDCSRALDGGHRRQRHAARSVATKKQALDLPHGMHAREVLRVGRVIRRKRRTRCAIDQGSFPAIDAIRPHSCHFRGTARSGADGHCGAQDSSDGKKHAKDLRRPAHSGAWVPAD